MKWRRRFRGWAVVADSPMRRRTRRMLPRLAARPSTISALSLSGMS
ncbi:MAG: hypothetical protein WCP22_01335 [Chlamydiota bacterium]